MSNRVRTLCTSVLCWIRVSTDISIRDLSSVGGLIVPLYSVVAHRNATLWVQSIEFRTSGKDPLTLLVNAAAANLQRHAGGFRRGASLAFRAFRRHMQDHFFIRF
jgi:hypothetical protein